MFYTAFKNLLIILCLFLLIGCKGEKKEPKGPVADYYNGVIGSLDKAKAVQRQANLNTLKSAITQYKIENGRNPQILEDLKYQLGEGFQFDDFQYNPETGQVTLRDGN